MRFPGPTLRRTITIAIVTVVLLAVSAAGALVVLTTVLHASSMRSASAVESVRLGEEVQRDLLLHESVHDPAIRERIAAGLRERLVQAHSRVGSSEQGDALVAADRAVTNYLEAKQAASATTDEVTAKHAAAFEALEQLVDLNIQDWQRAFASADRYDRAGTAVGIGLGGGVVLAAALLLWWLNTRALRPLFGLAATIRRFGRGSLDARASEEGPAELADMARQFNEMAEAIRRYRKDRQAFMAGVAHDLRNPLSVLGMSAALVSAKGAPLDPEKVQKMAAVMKRQVDRLDRMVGDLLDSASVEGGSVRLRLAQHDLRAIATEVAEQHQKTSAAHAIVLDIPDEPVRLRCDGMRIEQVLSNLVSNAIKYSPNGGRVSVALKSAAEDVTFSVTDEGIGMSEEDRANAFEPFQRSRALQDQVAGHGLGLFVVKRLVEAHAGRVEVRSTPGAGSTFEVRLPRVLEETPRLDTEGPEGVSPEKLRLATQ